MSNDSTARVLTIIGIVVCSLVFFIGSDLIGLILAVIFGVALPIVGYIMIRPQSKGNAAGLLIASGLVDIIFVSIIGGVLILVAGALVSVWKPLATETYSRAPLETRGPPPSSAAQPSITPAAKSVTPKGAKYCVACGAELKGDERYCPVCGGTIS